MLNLGDFAPGESVHGFYTTVDLSGGSITRATDGTLSVYKDNSDTQSTTGVTSGEDTDGLTGVHRYTIATTDAFYTPGSQFFVVLSGAVIDGETVNAVVGYFTIGKAGAMGRGTAQSGTASTIVLAAASAFGDDVPNGWLVVIVSGTGAGQARAITDYVTATDTATISPAWTTNPDNTSVYVLFAGVPGLSSAELTAAVADAVFDEASTDHQTAGTVGKILHELGDGRGADIDELVTDVNAILDDTGTSGVLVNDATPIDANITQINGADVTGDGDATPWGPV